MSSEFYEIFSAIQQYSPAFKFGKYDLSNHAPMTAWALHQLGAHDKEVRCYFTDYKNKLSKSLFINEENFTEHLGKKEYFHVYYKFFKEAMVQYGVKECITNFLNQLMSGVMTASFHPWIRLSYGVTLLQQYPKLAQKEIAISLAYWAAHYVPFVATNSAASLSWQQAVEFVYHHIKSSEKMKQSVMLYEKLNLLSEDELFTTQVPTVEITDGAEMVLQLEQFTRLLYLQESHLSSLHGITAVYALRILLPYIENDRSAVQTFCQAILALYCCCRAPKMLLDSVVDKEPASHMDWQSLKEYAMSSRDDHVIKLVYVCWQYKHEFAREEYFRVAERVVNEHKKQNLCENKNDTSIAKSDFGYWRAGKNCEETKAETKHKRTLSF